MTSLEFDKIKNALAGGDLRTKLLLAQALRWVWVFNIDGTFKLFLKIEGIVGIYMRMSSKSVSNHFITEQKSVQGDSFEEFKNNLNL